jgi:diguanylate cyclase (GGDEF)-like protein/PAS domain S-box-containing protein
MHVSFTPHVLPFVGAALVLAALLPVAWNNRRDPVARWFTATLVTLLIWAVGYVFEIVSVELESKILFANLQFLGVATVSVCWWEMVRRYLKLRDIPRAVTAFLWLMPVVTVVIAFANPAGLFRGTPFIVAGAAPFPVLHADYGPFYTWGLLPEVGLLNGTVLLLLGRAIFRSHRFYRRQYVSLFISLALPLVGTALYVFDLAPWSDYNLTVALTGISGLLMVVGLFRWRLFDIVPLARDLVVEDLADGVIAADRGGRIVDLNHSAERLIGIERKAVIGRPIDEVLSAYPVLVELLGAPVTGPAGISGHREMVIRADGISKYYGLSYSLVATRRGDCLGRAVVLHEVTERVRLLEQARELANKDDLTGLANRRHFFDLVTRELERARRYDSPVSFILLDVDHFKQVNDTFGHRAGDLVLREVATACRRALRSSDVMGRFGGEEFAILLPHTGIDEATEVADRLRRVVESIRAGVNTYGEGIAVTVSVGLAEFEGGSSVHPDNLDTLLERADKALYQAKGLGRNMVVTSKPATVRETAEPDHRTLRAVV